MLKTKLLLESETKLFEIDEQGYKDRKIVENCLNRITNSDLIKEQSMVLKDYVEDLLTNSKIKSKQTIKNNLNTLIFVSKLIKKPYSNWTEKDLKSFFANLKNKWNDKFMGVNTINTYKIRIKCFFEYYLKLKEPVEWIGKPRIKSSTINFNELPTTEEIKKMVECCMTNRDACIVSICFEGALRCGDLAPIKLEDIKRTEEGYYEIAIKYGKSRHYNINERTLLFIDSAPYLDEWLKIHNYRSNKKAPLFYSLTLDFGRQIQPCGVIRIIEDATKRAGINKRITPHTLRKTRLTQLAKDFGFNEKDLRLTAGWSSTSDMADTYIRYGQTEVHQKILKKKGIYKDKDMQLENALQPKTCVKCNTVNAATNIFCSKCNGILDLRTALNELQTKSKFDNVMNEFMKSQFATEFKEMFKEFLKKKN